MNLSRTMKTHPSRLRPETKMAACYSMTREQIAEWATNFDLAPADTIAAADNTELRRLVVLVPFKKQSRR